MISNHGSDTDPEIDWQYDEGLMDKTAPKGHDSSALLRSQMPSDVRSAGDMATPRNASNGKIDNPITPPPHQISVNDVSLIGGYEAHDLNCKLLYSPAGAVMETYSSASAMSTPAFPQTKGINPRPNVTFRPS